MSYLKINLIKAGSEIKLSSINFLLPITSRIIGKNLSQLALDWANNGTKKWKL
jgi:hypothetical protein